MLAFCISGKGIRGTEVPTVFIQGGLNKREHPKSKPGMVGASAKGLEKSFPTLTTHPKSKVN